MGQTSSRAEEYEDVITRPNVRRPEIGNGNDEEKQSAVRRPIDDDRDQTQPSRSDNNNNNDSPGQPGSSRSVTGGRARNQEIEEDAANDREKPALKWNSEEYRLGQRGEVKHEQETNPGNVGAQNRPKARLPVTENSGYYSSSYANENNGNEQPIAPAGNKQIINEVVTHHRLQDIPESEYDVTLNEALTPSFNNQETNLPSGFVLPIHRQVGRDPILQSTENSYKFSRPYNQQPSPQQQKTFVPSPQFLPLSGIGNGNGNERSRSVQYFRTPEAVHVTGPQYRHQRGPWQDYTGY